MRMLWLLPVLAGAVAVVVGIRLGETQAAFNASPAALTVTVAPDEARDGAAETDGAEPASLAVTGAPDGASVYVDDVFHGVCVGGKPLTVAGLAPGRHSVRVDAPGFRPNHRPVTLKPGVDAAVSLALTPEPTGRLLVATDPAGARVTVDGRPAGMSPVPLTLPPGRHAVTLTLPNHNNETRVVELPAFTARISGAAEPDAPFAPDTRDGEPVEVNALVADGPDAGAVRLFVPLRSRMTEMFRQRLRDNPTDAAAVNDFWVHLFDQGRYDQAAAVVVEGLYQAELGKDLDQAAKDGFNRLRGEMRNKQGRRGQPGWNEYIAALDRAIIRAVGEGRVCAKIMEEFNSQVNADADRDGFIDAFGRLTLTDAGRGEIGNFVNIALQRDMGVKLLPFFDQWMATPPQTLDECTAFLRYLQRTRLPMRDPGERAAVDERIRRVRAAAQPLRQPGQDDQWLWLEALLAREDGRLADWRRDAEASIDATLRLRMRANERRVALATELAEHADTRAKAGRLAGYVIRMNLVGDESVNAARTLRDKLAAQGVAVETEWPKTYAVTDWLAAGPFPAADAPRALAMDYPPENEPFARAQTFTDAPGANGRFVWRRVEWNPGDDIPAAALWARPADAEPEPVRAESPAGALYLRSWVYSAIARDVHADLATPAPFRLYGLDNAILAERADAAAPDAPAVRATLKLRAGFTPVLLKLAAPDVARPAPFTLTLHAPDDQPLTTLRASAARL